MSYFIFGGSGFIGTHLIALIDNLYPGTKIYNLDIVENNHEGKSTYINCDVRSEIILIYPLLPKTSSLTLQPFIVPRDIRTRLILRRIFVVQRMYVLLPRSSG
jgi:UDP-glucose 4-epimerase